MPYKDPERAREYARDHARKRRQDPEVRARERAAGRSPRNRERNRIAVRDHRARNIDKVRAAARESQRKRRAAMSPEERYAYSIWIRHHMDMAQWKAMYDEQDGKCYLCLEPLPTERAADGRSLIAIDHDHSCCPEDRSCALCRRGLACMACNRTIGMLGESPERLRVMAANLERVQAITRARIMSAPRQEALF